MPPAVGPLGGSVRVPGRHLCPGTWVTLLRDPARVGCHGARMPWHRTDPMSERTKFVVAAQMGRQPMTELCVESGISRKTGNKLLLRYEEEGIDDLCDRSRAPSRHPNQTTP